MVCLHIYNIGKKNKITFQTLKLRNNLTSAIDVLPHNYISPLKFMRKSFTTSLLWKQITAVPDHPQIQDFNGSQNLKHNNPKYIIKTNLYRIFYFILFIYSFIFHVPLDVSVRRKCIIFLTKLAKGIKFYLTDNIVPVWHNVVKKYRY